MIRRRMAGLLLLLCLLPALAVAEGTPVLPLDALDDVLALAPWLSLREDPGQRLDIDALLAGAAEDGFVPLGARSTSLGFSGSAWWVRVTLRNDGAGERRPVLRLAYPLLDEIGVWVVEDGRIARHWQTGNQLPLATRPIEHRDFLFPLQLAPGAEQVVYLRAASAGPINLTLALYAEDALLPRLGDELMALGGLYGCLALLAICVMLLWLFVRDESFLHYVAYLLTYGSYMALFNGVAQQYLLHSRPDLIDALKVQLPMAAIFFLIQFSRSILRVPTVAPRLDRINRLLQAMCVALVLAALVLPYAKLVHLLAPPIIGTMLMLPVMGVAALRARQPTAGYFLLAWSVFVLGVLAYYLKSFGLLPHNFFTHYGFQIGTLFEFVLLSIALGIRVQDLRQQSQTDTLTTLGNRSRYDALVEHQFAQHLAERSPLSLLVIDVDHFKRINDEYGHAVGDRMLQRVAEQIRRGLSRGQRACRYGGEEFVILLPRTPAAEACAIAEQLRARIAGELRDVGVTISVGVACADGDRFADPRSLFRAADEALYAAKRGGRDRVVVFGAGERATPAADALPA